MESIASVEGLPPRYACPACRQGFLKWSVCLHHVVSTVECRQKIVGREEVDPAVLQGQCRVEVRPNIAGCDLQGRGDEDPLEKCHECGWKGRSPRPQVCPKCGSLGALSNADDDGQTGDTIPQAPNCVGTQSSEDSAAPPPAPGNGEAGLKSVGMHANDAWRGWRDSVGWKYDDWSTAKWSRRWDGAVWWSSNDVREQGDPWHKRDDDWFPPRTKLYVGNLPSDVSEQDVKQLCKEFGHLLEAPIVMQGRQRTTNRSCALVRFRSPQEAERCRAKLRRVCYRHNEGPLDVRFANYQRVPVKGKGKGKSKGKRKDSGRR